MLYAWPLHLYTCTISEVKQRYEANTCRELETCFTHHNMCLIVSQRRKSKGGHYRALHHSVYVYIYLYQGTRLYSHVNPPIPKLIRVNPIIATRSTCISATENGFRWLQDRCMSVCVHVCVCVRVCVSVFMQLTQHTNTWIYCTYTYMYIHKHLEWEYGH